MLRLSKRKWTHTVKQGCIELISWTYNNIQALIYYSHVLKLIGVLTLFSKWLSSGSSIKFIALWNNCHKNFWKYVHEEWAKLHKDLLHFFSSLTPMITLEATQGGMAQWREEQTVNVTTSSTCHEAQLLFSIEVPIS